MSDAGRWCKCHDVLVTVLEEAQGFHTALQRIADGAPEAQAIAQAALLEEGPQ